MWLMSSTIVSHKRQRREYAKGFFGFEKADTGSNVQQENIDDVFGSLGGLTIEKVNAFGNKDSQEGNVGQYAKGFSGFEKADTGSNVQQENIDDVFGSLGGLRIEKVNAFGNKDSQEGNVGQCSATPAPNIIGSTINVVPSFYANKLSPKFLTKANLWKLEANVRNGADRDYGYYFGYGRGGTKFYHIVDKINVLEKQILEGKLMIMDDDEKLWKKVEYPVNLGSDDEVEPVENEMASFLVSKPMGVGYGRKSLLEQYRESSVDDDYDSYDDDMYEGSSLPM
nr:hypothetical protein [Tanacetum cinerariifolium]